MIRLYLLLLFFFSFAVAGAQADPSGNQPMMDSLIQQSKQTDSVQNRLNGIDSSSSVVITDSLRLADSLVKRSADSLLQQQTVVDRKADEEKPGVRRQVHGKDLLFYVLLAILLLFSFLRNVFAKYFNDLFRLFFRTTLKQRQIREQLMQTPLPSLLLNGFFVLSAALYADFLLLHFNLITETEFWLFYLYCGIALSAIYLIKFIGLKVMGWLFTMPEAANSYIFIVFIINKVIGVFLLPFLVLLAFLEGNAYTVTIIVSLCGVGGLFLYRFILAYSAMHNQVKFNPFHFFLYFCAVEVAPLLLIYKLLIEIFQ